MDHDVSSTVLYLQRRKCGNGELTSYSRWDDHEIANNGYRDGFSGLNNTEDSFEEDGMGVSVDQRKMNAVRAYFEWMPIRQVDMDNNLR